MNFSEAYDYYEVLGVMPSATPDEIRTAYRRAAARWHPDVNRAPEAVEMMKLVNAARGVLLNPLNRREYDAYRHAGCPRQRPRTTADNYRPPRAPRPSQEPRRPREEQEEQRRRRQQAWEQARRRRERAWQEPAAGQTAATSEASVDGGGVFVGVFAVVVAAIVLIAIFTSTGDGGRTTVDGGRTTVAPVQRSSTYSAPPVTSGTLSQSSSGGSAGGGGYTPFSAGGSYGSSAVSGGFDPFNQPPRPTGIESIDRINQLNYENQQRMYNGFSAPSTNPFGTTGNNNPFGNTGYGGNSGGSFGNTGFGSNSGGSFGGSSGGFSGGGSFGGGSFGGGSSFGGGGFGW